MNITVYSRPNCVFCSKVKNLIESYNLHMDEKMADKDFEREWLRKYYPQATTFPVVIIDGMYIGGFNETVRYLAAASPINESTQFLQE